MKLRRKLLSAGLALGATALTLTTSTFAWYTANTEVSATAISGQSAANGDSLLMISKTGEKGSFSNTVSWSISNTSLQPVQYTQGTATTAEAFDPVFKSFANGVVSADAVSVTTAATSLVYKVDLYFQSSTDVTVYLKALTVTNNTSTSGLPTKDILSTTGTELSNLSTTATYSMDLLRALKVAYSTETKTTANNVSTTAYGTGAAYSFDSGSATFGAVYSNDSSAVMTNAHTYYTAVTGKSITSDGALAVSTAITKGINFGQTPASLQPDNYLLVHFYFFIDGWDLQCFDAVQGQKFSVTMGFSSENPNA